MDISSRTEKTKLMKALYEELEKAMNHDKKMIIKEEIQSSEEQINNQRRWQRSIQS